ncbi:MAG: YicC family protein [Acidobacteriota bacterium]|jgi:uncharacterized protein (TIGR00255 family)|nr:YicC family protein [Acidobacteriota bacterium]
MILSMTGYGAAVAQEATLTVSVEIRTVNHRFLDLHVRVPREYQFLETEIAPLVRSALDRGRVDVGVTVKNSTASAFRIDSELLRRYLEYVDGLYATRVSSSFETGQGGEGAKRPIPDMVALLGLPGVLRNDGDTAEGCSGEAAAAISGLAKTGVKEALESVLAMRRQEGDALRADMLRNLATIENATDEIKGLAQDAPAEYLERLRVRLDQLLSQGGVEPQRLAQEAAIIADRCDISEELARMSSHIGQYRALVEAKEKAGKKLDFLLQEMQREANTILSKSVILEITHRGIAIKTDIEKLREQVQNIE